MSSNPSSNSKHSWVVFVLIAAVCAGLAISFWRTGMLTFTQPQVAAVSAPSPKEDGWDSQVLAVREGRSDRIEIAQQLIGDAQLKELVGLTNLRELILDRSNITDAGVDSLEGLSQLDHLRLRGAMIKDAGFQKICELRTLKRLNLPQADLTDEGLTGLAKLPNLELLRMGSPRVTEAGMKHIGSVESLRWLHLIDVPVTDAGLQALDPLKNLESLYLDGAKISDGAYEKFFKAHPDLHVHIDQRHHDRDPGSHSH